MWPSQRVWFGADEGGKGSMIELIADLQISISPVGPTKNLERHYNRVVGRLFVRFGTKGQKDKGTKKQRDNTGTKRQKRGNT